MARLHHTVIFVPHARARLRKWQITNMQLGLIAAAFALLTLATCGFIWAHFNSAVSPGELDRLRSENSHLRQVNQGFESSIDQLRTRLSSSEDRTRRLAIMAGVENLGTAEPGVGGGVPLAAGAAGQAQLDRIVRESAHLSSALDAVEVRLEERVRWISSIPSLMPVRGILTSGFGTRSDPLTHGPGLHLGIDIAANPGQPVLAAADGIVVLAADQNGYGLAVFISHGFGMTTRYGHLAEITVRPGQRVQRGAMVGRVGSTGRATGYHLHYEVRVDGNPVNPLAYILDGSSAG
jgi:murein DD-endopeptidase MepM/ murein hydrolase activator NlpD